MNLYGILVLLCGLILGAIPTSIVIITSGTLFLQMATKRRFLLRRWLIERGWCINENSMDTCLSLPVSLYQIGAKDQIVRGENLHEVLIAAVKIELT